MAQGVHTLAQAMRLPPEGERVARQLAMTDDDGQDALMAALLEGGPSGP